MNTNRVTWITTFTAAVSIVVLASAAPPGGGPVTPDCITCVQQACCTSQACPACSTNCGATLELLSYMVWVPVDGDYEEVEATQQLCYVQFSCLAMPQMCNETEWWCLADYYNPSNLYIPGCNYGPRCDSPDPDPDPSGG